MENRWWKRGGTALVVLVTLFLALDAGMKLAGAEPAIAATTELGFSMTATRLLGVVLGVCTFVYAVPATRVLGAILLTGYLGGAMAVQALHGSPLGTHVLFGGYVGVAAWASVWLRSIAVRQLIPYRRGDGTMSGKTITFKAQMNRTGANTTGVVVPPESVRELGAGARPAVVAEINGYTYGTTIGVMKGLSMLPFSAHHREASGIGGGDPVAVALRLDTDSRSTDVPEDLARALALEPTVEAAFRKLAPSRRKADVENVVGAKTPETRSRRINAILTRLR